MTPSALHRKMAHGAFWSFLEKGGQQGLSLIMFLVLARLVGPEEYGLTNFCFMFFALANFILMGLADGIVSLQIDDERDLSGLFWVVLAIGTALSLFFLIAATPFAILVNQPRLAGLITCFSVLPPLLALSAIPHLLLLKEMKFKIYTVRTLAATIIGGAVGIVMAVKGYGAYALAGQQIALYAVVNLVVWPSAGWRPRFTLCLADLKKNIQPGIGLIGSNFFDFLGSLAPRLAIGWLSGPIGLGFYALVTRLHLAVVEILIAPPMAVLYPAFSKIKNDKEEQRKIASQMLLLCGILLFPLLALAAAAAPLFVPLLFGDAWSRAVPLFQIYILGAACVPLTQIVGQLFQANVQMPRFLKLNALSVMLSLGTIPLLLLPNGLLWMVAGLVSIQLLMQPLYLIFLARWTGIHLEQGVVKLLPAIFSAAGCFVVARFLINEAFPTQNTWSALLVVLLIGTATGSSTLFLFQRREIGVMLSFLKKLAPRRATPVPSIEIEHNG